MQADAAVAAYESIAPIYDELTRENDYEMWLGVLLAELEKHGLRKGRLLDVGCGTGRAFEPMLRRGWRIVGCDLSPAMLEKARRKFGDAVALELADARSLPRIGEFELVLALNDVANYLTGDGQLARALAAMRANLAPAGLLLFDVNTLGLYRENFADGESERMGAERWTWRGLSEEASPGGTFDAELSGAGVATHLHRQRHHTAEQVERALDAAGLERLAVLGQREEEGEIILEHLPDEERDYKVVYIARGA